MRPRNLTLRWPILTALASAALTAPPARAQFTDGDLFVTDGSNQILRVDPNLNVTLFADANDGLDLPYGLAFSPQGTLVVANQNGNSVVELDSAGNATVLYDAVDGINSPGGSNGLTFDPAGDLYLVNDFPRTVLRFPADGAAPQVFADGADGLNFPGGLAFEDRGDLLVADGFQLLRLDPWGNGTLFDKQGCASSIVVRNNGDVYVTCNGGDVYRYPGGDPLQGALLVQFPSMVVLPSLAFDPEHTVLLITSISTGNLIAVDPDSGSWQELLPAGTFSQPSSMAVFGEGSAPRVRRYGPGLAGTGGLVPSLWMTGNPVPGGAVTLQSRDFVGGAYSAVLVGVEPATLDALGGTLYVNLGAPRLFLFRSLAGAAGVAGAGDDDLGGVYPNDPSLAGLHLYHQHLAFDPAAPRGLSMSNGLDVMLGQ